MTKIKISFLFALIISFLLITTCSNDSSITGNSDKTIAKPTELFETNNSQSDENKDCTIDISERILLIYLDNGAEGLIVAMINWVLINKYHKDLPGDYLDGLDPEYFSGPGGSPKYNKIVTQPLYNFRDNYLSKSNKGQEYTKYYYELSKYGIQNNLVNKYPLEHIELLLISTAIAQDLQNGASNDQVLIDNEFAEKIEDMLKVYGNHKNHRDIDPVLDYLELELNKYTNKPKSEIDKDFQ